MIFWTKKYQISAQTDKFDILKQICSKWRFRSGTAKMNITIEFIVLELDGVPDFSLTKNVNFRTKLWIEFRILDLD